MKTIKQIVQENNEARLNSTRQAMIDESIKLQSPSFVVDSQIPSVLLLKRTAITVAPTGQKVALYYSQALNKSLSITFGSSDNFGPQVGMNEETSKGDEDTYNPPRSTVRGAIKNIRKDKGSSRYVRLGGVVGAALGGTVGTAALMGAAGTAIAAKKSAHAIKKGVVSLKAKRKPISEDKKPFSHLIKQEIADKAASSRDSSVTKSTDKQEVKPKVAFKGFMMGSPTKLKERIEEIRLQKQIEENAAIDAVKSVVTKAKGVAKSVGRKIKGSASKASSALSKGKDAIKDKLETAAEKAKAHADDRNNSYNDNYERPQPSSPLSSSEPVPGRVSTSTRITRDPIASKEWQRSMSESFDNNLDVIKDVASSAQPKELQFGDRAILINNTIAKKVMRVYESLNKSNKKKVEAMLNESADSLKKVINFAVKQ